MCNGIGQSRHVLARSAQRWVFVPTASGAGASASPRSVSARIAGSAWSWHRLDCTPYNVSQKSCLNGEAMDMRGTICEGYTPRTSELMRKWSPGWNAIRQGQRLACPLASLPLKTAVNLSSGCLKEFCWSMKLKIVLLTSKDVVKVASNAFKFANQLFAFSNKCKNTWFHCNFQITCLWLITSTS